MSTFGSRNGSVPIDLTSDPHYTAEGEVALWSEVLISGIREAARSIRAKEDTPQSRWIDSPNFGPGAFIWLCDLFGLPSDTIRNRVKTHYEEILKPKTKTTIKREPDEI